MPSHSGKFVISLDFELLWGVLDIKNRDAYNNNILAVREVIPKTLEIFEKYNISGTFSTVGFLFAENIEELIKYIPNSKPNYTNIKLSPYESHIDNLKDNETDNNLHFASDLINLIKSNKKQEIGSHTFCHYYCLEDGTTINDFRKDIEAAITIAKNKNISLKSIVFPRNQYSDVHLQVLADLGITSYRGNASAWFYKPSKGSTSDRIHFKVSRFLDSYINLSGHNTYSMSKISSQYPYNIPSSGFLRPYLPKNKLFEKFRLKRIKNNMTFAAKNKEVYHLWWHPHNFGTHQDKNFEFLEEILVHYKYLNKKYNFESITMTNLANNINNLKD